jgi:hypothetical protein
MNQIIEFLARLGSDASLTTQNILDSTLKASRIQESVKSLISNRKVSELKKELQLELDSVCVIFIPAEDENEDESAPEKEEPETIEQKAS